MTRTQMSYWSVSIAGIVSLLLGIHAIFADQPSADPGNVIVLGMKVDAAQKILAQCKIEEILLEYSMSKDTDWLFRRLSREVDVVFDYSKTNHRITRIVLLYRYPPYCKPDYVMVSARGIRFEKDGSYVVHFENPKPDKKSQTSAPLLTPSLPPAGFQPSAESQSPPTRYMPPTNP